MSGGMSGTAGQEALREAARLEAARVYGRTCREVADPPTPADDAAILYWHRHGQSNASIAFRIGTTKANVRSTLERFGAA